MKYNLYKNRKMHPNKVTLLAILLQVALALGISNSPPKENFEEETDANLINSWTASMKSNKTASTPLAVKSDLSEKQPENDLKTCNCMVYYQCDQVCPKQREISHVGPEVTNTTNSEVDNNSDILGIVDVRENLNTSKSEATGCPHYFDVLCKTPKSDLENATAENSAVSKKASKEWFHSQCGHRNENGIGFKITGADDSESEFGEFPWTAIVAREEIHEVEGPNGKENATKNIFVSGGSLIHPKMVVTAAHSVFRLWNSADRDNIKVRLGEWDVETMDEPLPYQDVKVKQVIIRSDLYMKGLFNDIALLVLETPVKLAPNVDTICLPPESTNIDDYNGENCFSSGWGKDNLGDEWKYQKIMKKVEIPIISSETCLAELQKSKLGANFLLHDSFICAGGNGKDTCKGDGGGPLACRAINSPNYILLGIVDWGIGCNGDTPGVYVNVAKFVPWILEQMQSLHLDPKMCTF